jgi:hypothetical protein
MGGESLSAISSEAYFEGEGKGLDLSSHLLSLGMTLTNGPDRELALGASAAATSRGSEQSVFDVPPEQHRDVPREGCRRGPGSGQAQGSTGHGRRATAGRATDPYVEEGLEVPPNRLGSDARGRPWRRFRVRGGEGRGGSGRGEQRGDTLVTQSRLRTGGRLRRAGKASRGRTRRRGQGDLSASAVRKRGEPQGRERVATHAHGNGGGNRRGGGKPRGRNARVRWHASSEGGPARGSREWTPVSPGRRRGDLWTNPGEEVQPGDRLDRRKWQVPGKAAPKARRVARTCVHPCASGPGRGPRRRACARERAGERREGGGKPMSHDFARAGPPISPPPGPLRGIGWDGGDGARDTRRLREEQPGNDPGGRANPRPDRRPARCERRPFGEAGSGGRPESV